MVDERRHQDPGEHLLRGLLAPGGVLIRHTAIAFVLLLGLSTSAVAQEPLDPVAACVRDNLVKYTPPDRAVVEQYLSLESACRARIEGQGGAEVEVTGLPAGGDGADGPGTPGGGGQDPGAQPGSPPGSTEPGGEPGAPSAGAPSSGAGPDGSGTGGREGERPATPSARADVLAALDTADAAAPTSPSGLLHGPAWLIGLVAASLALVAGAAWVGARLRRR